MPEIWSSMGYILAITKFGTQFTQICRKIAFLSTKLLLEKSAKTKKKLKTKNHENVYNLWRILGTKLVVLEDFWDHIFKTVFPKHFFLFSTLNSRMSRNTRKLRHKVRNGHNLPHESPNFQRQRQRQRQRQDKKR